MIVLYTAICGQWDVLRHTGRLNDDRWHAFVDEDPRPTEDGPYLGWQIHRAAHAYGSPRLDAKRHQVLPHLDFPKADYSIYMDGSHVVAEHIDPERLVSVYLRTADLATFKHGTRDCAYAEAGECILKHLDDGEIIGNQMARYKAEGFPEHYGLPAITVLLRRHTPSVQRFNELWWREIMLGSVRDQLSFPYVAWKTGVRWATITGDAFYSPLVHYVPHGHLWSEGGVMTHV